MSETSQPQFPGHELKKSYQRNMLIGLLATVLLSVATALVIVHAARFNATGVEGGSSVGQTAAQPHARHDNALPIGGSPVELNRLNPYADRHAGFAGFRDYRIVSGVALPGPTRPPDIVAPASDQALLGYGGPDLAAGDEGFGLFSGTESGDYFFPEDTAPPHPSTDLGVRLIKKVPPEIPWLARENDVEGYVEVLMYLDDRGKAAPYHARPCNPDDTAGQFYLDCRLGDGRQARLAFSSGPAADSLMYLILKEEPTEYDFARRLTDVLPEWVFAPEIKDGEPTGAFVRIGFWFCDDSRDWLSCPDVVLSGM